MKRIIKKLPNTPLENWKAKQASEHLAFGNLRDPDREKVLEWLIREQGALCCYTGIRVGPSTSHIEHLKPQTICRMEDKLRTKKEYEDIAGHNLLAAYPNLPGCPYGAQYRGSWYGENAQGQPSGLFVDPLRADCEKRFRFDENGRISAADSRDAGAVMTIQKLNLDHEDLEGRRLAAIRSIFFQKSRRLSEAEIRKIMMGLDEKDGRGEFRAFCYVLKQAGAQLLRAGRREHLKKAGIQKAKKTKRK